MKMEKYNRDANTELSDAFLEMLEGQFPITKESGPVDLRFASDFADRLRVHVNHLNRANQKTMGKTTTRIITESFLKEAKRLMVCTDWQVITIALALGFKEAAHFSNFFKGQTGVRPSRYRKAQKDIP